MPRQLAPMPPLRYLSVQLALTADDDAVREASIEVELDPGEAATIWVRYTGVGRDQLRYDVAGEGRTGALHVRPSSELNLARTPNCPFTRLP